MATPSDLSRSNHWTWTDLAALIVVGVVAALPFLQVGSFAFLNYDDPMHVAAQPAVLSGLNAQSGVWAMTATPSNLWHPLTWLSYMLEVSWFGGGADSPGVHHWGNVILHLGATLGFYILLRLLKVSTWVAALVALLFSLHPLHVEPVAWISSRKDVLYAFLAMASLACYCWAKQKNLKSAYGLTAVLLTLALCSKPSAVVVPVLYLLLDVWMSDREGDRSPILRQFCGSLKRNWMYFLLSFVVAVVAILVQYAGSHHAFMGQQGLWERLSYLPASVSFYLQHSLYPRYLTFEYAYPEGIRYGVLTVCGVLVLLLVGYGVLTRGGLVRMRYRSGVIGLLWFLVCLAPVLGVFYVGSGFSADRYSYLALAGLAVPVALYLDALQRGLRNMSIAVLSMIVVFFALLSFKQSKVWQDDAALFTHGVKVEPRSGTAHTNLATLYRMQGEDDLALVHYQKALRLHASQHIVCYNMAQIYAGRSEWGEAVHWCRQSIKQYPDYARAHNLLGRLLQKRGGSFSEVLASYERAYQLDPERVRFAMDYARNLARAKRYTEAKEVLLDTLNRDKGSRLEREQITAMLQRLETYR
ncbi:hypothetical protein HW115_16745 [Verrucomicrobiaceae bacterium N1E253]|uniref:Tetratricopeptide repeat protein n=1 Tax=Oceaniferula marina TaxID=2748318 RepID=A0A851GID2_9BACT|nr:tetratricopeptide repeat protein [Oceaniferula marina]NWK57273.1 hypothetical protein [Oceaniferula marina]